MGDVMSNMPNVLPKKVVKEICSFIQMRNIGLYDISEPLKNGIFNIIENDCTVIYYPIEDVDEKNDGFLLSNIPMKDGTNKNIIFINTYQTEEKQVFAAAHEWGHYLGVDKYIKEKCGNDLNSEDIVNRFAAELLMPSDMFRRNFFEFARKKEKVNHCISSHDMFIIIADLMNKFSVPYNAVAIRLFETEIINETDAKMLVDGNKSMSLKNIKMIMEKIISTGDYGTLTTRSKKCEIKGLEELLDLAEKNDLVSKIKMNRLREKFRIISNKRNILRKDFIISEE